MNHPSNVSSIQEDSAVVDHGYYDIEGASGGKSSTSTSTSTSTAAKLKLIRIRIRISDLPKHVQQTAMKMDLNGDGALDHHDIARTMEKLDTTERNNKTLNRIVAAFAILCVLLNLSHLRVNIAAARLSKNDVNVNANAIAYVKGSTNSNSMMSVAEMPNGNLVPLKEVISTEGGDVRFVVKGHARDMLTGNALLLVEGGGTLTYDNSNGIVDASGDARTLLEAAFGSDAFLFDGYGGEHEYEHEYEDHTHTKSESRRRHRHLSTGCGSTSEVFPPEDVSDICPFTGRYAFKCKKWKKQQIAAEEEAAAEEENP